MRLDHLLSKENYSKEILFIFQCTNALKIYYGDIAQLARAPALHAGGQEFESLYLHHTFYHKKVKKIRNSTLKNI